MHCSQISTIERLVPDHSINESVPASSNQGSATNPFRKISKDRSSGLSTYLPCAGCICQIVPIVCQLKKRAFIRLAGLLDEPRTQKFAKNLVLFAPIDISFVLFALTHFHLHPNTSFADESPAIVQQIFPCSLSAAEQIAPLYIALELRRAASFPSFFRV